MIQNKDKLEMSEFHNVSIMVSINTLFLQFDFLAKIIRNKIRECNIQRDFEKTYERCSQIYGGKLCHKSGFGKYSVMCPEGFVLYNKFICYKKCPEGFKEMNNKCLKPENYILKMYSTKEECEEEILTKMDSEKEKIIDNDRKQQSNQIPDFLIGLTTNILSVWKPPKNTCIEAMNGTFYTKKCNENFKKRFMLYCISHCPSGLISNGEYCYKRYKKDLPSPVVFNFNDLFT